MFTAQAGDWGGANTNTHHHPFRPAKEWSWHMYHVRWMAPLHNVHCCMVVFVHACVHRCMWLFAIVQLDSLLHDFHSLFMVWFGLWFWLVTNYMITFKEWTRIYRMILIIKSLCKMKLIYEKVEGGNTKKNVSTTPWITH